LEQAQAGTAALDVSLGRLVEAYSRSDDDRALYAYAHEMFFARLRVIEQESGKRLMCGVH